MTVLSPDQVQGIVVDPPAAPSVNPADVRVDHVATTPGDAAASLGMGFGRGVAESPGWVGDLAGLLRSGYTKLTGAVPDVAGSKLFGPRAPVTSRDLATLIDQTGVKYDPQGDTAKRLYDVAHFAGGTVGQGGLSKLSSVAGGLSEAIPQEIARQAVKDALVGTGAGIGVEGAKYGADKADITAANHPYQRAALEFGAALLGGGATGVGLNHLTSRLDNPANRPPLMDDYEAAGVEPRFPSDVRRDSSFFDDILPNRLGARGKSADSARQTQDELGDYVHSVLSPHNGNGTAPADIGTDIKGMAGTAVRNLKDETSSRYDLLNANVPPATPIATTETAQLIAKFSRSADPEVRDALNNPVYQRFSTVLSKPSLTFDDMTQLRQSIGGLMQRPGNLSGTDIGLLDQLYKAMTNDSRAALAATSNPNPWISNSKLYDQAINTARENGVHIGDLEKNVTRADTPENAPAWLLGESQKGPTRLNRLFDQTDPQDAGDMGRRLLLMAGTDPATNQFNLDRFMKFYNSRQWDAQDALLRDPAVADGLSRASLLYGETAKSRGLIGANNGLSYDPLTTAGLGFAGAHALGGDLGTAGMVTAVGALAEPMIARGLAGYAQRGGFVGRGTNLGETMIHVGMEGASLFPDVYHTPAAAPPVQTPPPGSDIHSWLGTVDRPTAVSYVGDRLGPQAAAQLQNTDTEGFRAAMANMAADPSMRAALATDGSA